MGLIGRHLEAAGFPTIGLTSARTITASANPPRSVYLDLPLGHTSGLPNDRKGQRSILSQALAAGVAMTEPGSIVDLDFRYIDDNWKADPLSWSRKRQSAGKTGESGGDTRRGRSADPVWQHEADAVAANEVDWDEQCLVCVGIDRPG